MSQRIESFRDLVVWQRSMQLVDEIERIVETLTPYQRWWLGLQMLRAALSIPSNIAEGHDSEYTRLYLRRLADARGSTREVQAQLLVIRSRKNVQPHSTDTALGFTDEIGRMPRALSSQVRASSARRRGTKRRTRE